MGQVSCGEIYPSGFEYPTKKGAYLLIILLFVGDVVIHIETRVVISRSLSEAFIEVISCDNVPLYRWYCVHICEWGVPMGESGCKSMCIFFIYSVFGKTIWTSIKILLKKSCLYSIAFYLHLAPKNNAVGTTHKRKRFCMNGEPSLAPTHASFFFSSIMPTQAICGSFSITCIYHGSWKSVFNRTFMKVGNVSLNV